jgi:hypothetical protein
MTESKFTTHTKPRARISWGRLFLFILSVALAIMLIAKAGDIKRLLGLSVDDSYYAVFLNNNEVYFGQLEQGGGEVILKNVYYFNTGADNASSTSLQLVKLGSEIHGPTDTIYIPKTSVNFYEKLRDDSRVVKSIKEGELAGAIKK